MTSLTNKIPYGRFVAVGVDFNASNTDTSVTVVIPAGCTSYKLDSVNIGNASQTLTTATIGVFTGAGGTGTTLLANAAITVATATLGGANSSQTLAGVATVNANATTLFVRVGTAQGAPATGDVTLTLKYLT